jgi:hypothetical protein
MLYRLGNKAYLANGYRDGGKGSLSEYAFKDIMQEEYQPAIHLKPHLSSLMSIKNNGYAGVLALWNGWVWAARNPCYLLLPRLIRFHEIE